MANLYLETAERAEPTPPFSGERKADVVVIGGGFTGLSTALHLAERGADVVLLEAREPGWGASGRNGGQVNPGLKHDPDTVERDFGVELGGRMLRFAGEAPAFVFALIERLGIRCELKRCGTLRAAKHPKHVARVRVTVEQLRRRGVPVEFLDGGAVARATGTTVYAGALFDQRGGALNPLSYARGLAKAALAAGASVHGNARVQSLEPERGAWRVRTADGSVVSRHVVLATNGYTDSLWPQLSRTIVPVFGAIAASEPLPEAQAREILPGGQVLYESGAVTVYYRVDDGRRLIIGGRGPMQEIQSAADIPHIVHYARRLWPSLKDYRFTHGWGGRLGFTADQYPHVHEPADGVLVCLGYSGRGVALGTALGAALAQRISEPETDFPMPITALKTIPFHGYWPISVPAAILVGRVADALGL
jgi:glycine/D-amino acid oxidase-like deaminating enzyme